MLTEYCPLCGHLDCDCEDVLTPEEFEKLVKDEKKDLTEITERPNEQIR